ncbi:hypothetical protein [Aequorivita lipolytica]|uniref:Uncharacterized protein n=1 Tax=Aequorivita lipolytica TaxID=153267 RepID=A0A5C6YU99_9FLAO|nr:hypothetical protein [Aequorivita lipolytica]TXD70555.1 hypothetical protein ESV24_00220 [Aequorivita lipolytica]
MDTINSTAHHTGSNLYNINLYAENNGYVKSDAFNIYAPHELIQGAGESWLKNTKVAMTASLVAIGTILPHEIGHCFNLHHTFGPGNDRPDPVNCERVTRIPSDPEYNAHIAGDVVIDTNAVPNFNLEQHSYYAYALLDAGLVALWWEGIQIAKNPNGFNGLINATAIAQALVDYGFTQTEINYLRYNPAIRDAYTDVPNCLYAPDGRINDLTVDFFKDCGGSSYTITQADIKNMMAYSNSTCGRIFSSGQKVRMHETIESDYQGRFSAVMTDKDYDLYVKDIVNDIGQEPNIHTDVFWNSKDIWVRNQNDGTINQEHQNPVYHPSNPNYVYVRVSNKGCSTSSGNDQLKLYWAKANTALDWDEYWTGQVLVGNVKMGDTLGTKIIPPIVPGSETILEFEWPVPNPQDYIGINPNPWHFCLLSRIESNDDPMTFSEGTFITDNVKNNNNIAWKNTTVIEIIPNTPSIGAVIGVSNPLGIAKTYSLELLANVNEPGKPIYQEAEIGILMDDVLYDAWENGGNNGSNFVSTTRTHKIIATGNNVLIDDIAFGANDYGTAYITFNFLTAELTNKQNYTYQVIQRDKATNKIIGGETFEIKKHPRPTFEADAGDNEEIERNESITLQADDINEDAVYNWYAPDGTLIYTGTTLTISPEMTQQYKLEIISDLDGLKDYDNVTVTVNPYRIISMAPNPVSSLLSIDYMVEGVNSA